MRSRKIPASHAAAAHSAVGQSASHAAATVNRRQAAAQVSVGVEMTVRAQAENGAQRARIPRVGGKLTTLPDPPSSTGSNGTRSLRPSKANRHTGRTSSPAPPRIKASASAPSTPGPDDQTPDALYFSPVHFELSRRPLGLSVRRRPVLLPLRAAEMVRARMAAIERVFQGYP